ncbi:MAG: hypothetical protein NTZ05_03505 [Chloroflexi bacterium]|nr:hypothetical protein [Chloroflexota bacterium]
MTRLLGGGPAPRYTGGMARRTRPEPTAVPDLPTERLTVLHEALLTWYARQQRALPWRATRDPYRVLISEVMLQGMGYNVRAGRLHELAQQVAANGGSFP